MSATKSRVLVLLADGAEEIETTVIVDVLRRGGAEVVLAGVDGEGPVTCSRAVRILPDVALSDIAPAEPAGEFDLIVLPGGLGGTDRLCASAAVGKILQHQQEQHRAIAAICAAPKALCAHGIGGGKAMTSHPCVRDLVAAHGEYREQSVVCDGELITSRGPGTAMAFALALVEHLAGREVAEKVRAPMMLEA